jgi:hypothetical protein
MADATKLTTKMDLSFRVRRAIRRTLQTWQRPSGCPTFFKGSQTMPEDQANEERPCLHCVMVELIDQFFAENPSSIHEPDTIDTDEVITAVAKTVAELTCSQDGNGRQQIIENLMREIIDYDAEFRREEAAGTSGSAARH